MATAAKKAPEKKAAVKKAGPVAVPAQPAKESPISRQAMLVTVTVSRWKPKVTDDEISDKVAKDHSADLNIGKYRKRLFPKPTFADAASVENEIRREFWDRTVPWADDRGRLLKNVGFQAFQAKMNELQDKFYQAWHKVIPNKQAYDDLVKAAEKWAGDLFDPDLYPSYEDACKKFGVKVTIGPMPASKDFQVEGILETEVARIKQQIDEDAAATLQSAMKDVWGRLHEVIGHMVKRLNAYALDPDTGKVTNTFRDSLVTNISDLCDLLPSLNITNDSNLTKFEAEIRKTLVAHPAEVLRDDEKIRKQVAVTAEQILKKMEGYLA